MQYNTVMVFKPIINKKEIIHIKNYLTNNTVKSEQGKQFILAYSSCMGKIEELELNLFHLNKPMIKPHYRNYWVTVGLQELSDWYSDVEEVYNKVDELEVKQNRYDWMLDNLCERVKTCLQKISVSSFINK